MLVQVWAFSCISRTTMQLTNNACFCIRSMYIGRSAGVAGIVEHLWNIKSILVANLFWVTWNSRVNRWRFPSDSQLRFKRCCTPTINILSLIVVDNNRGGSAHQIEHKNKTKNSIDLHKYAPSKLSLIVKGPTTYSKGYFF